MKVICKDNSHTWRNVLTVGNEYSVLMDYVDSYGVKILNVKCDDGEIRPYRADRFESK